MISRAQQILLKRAQRQADLPDGEYRDALAVASGCRSSTDPRLDQRGFDKALAYFEAIYWRKVDLGQLQGHCGPSAVFRQRRFWAEKNTRFETSRDRWRAALETQIREAETALGKLGYGAQYVATIRQKATEGRDDTHARYVYRTALRRTLKAKRRHFLSGSLSR